MVFYDTIQPQCSSMRALWLCWLFPGRLSKWYSTDTSYSCSIYAGPKRSTAQLSPVPSVGCITTTHRKYSGLDIKTPSILGQMHIKCPYTRQQCIRSEKYHYQWDQACRPVYFQLPTILYQQPQLHLQIHHHKGSTEKLALRHQVSTSLTRPLSKLWIKKSFPNLKAVTQSQPVSSFSSQTAWESKDLEVIAEATW